MWGHRPPATRLLGFVLTLQAPHLGLSRLQSRQQRFDFASDGVMSPGRLAAKFRTFAAVPMVSILSNSADGFDGFDRVNLGINFRDGRRVMPQNGASGVEPKIAAQIRRARMAQLVWV